MKRKDFIRYMALLGAAPVAFYCTPPPGKKGMGNGGPTGPDAKTGHKLRDKTAFEVTKNITKKTVIIGGGISGLTAAYTLSKNGINDYTIIELEKETGGNSSYRKNAVSAYPLGAHYLPIPNLNQPAMTDFLREADIITGFDDKKRPIYRDEYLCQEPEERLFIKNSWQEGLVPNYGVPDKDKQEIKTFFDRMQAYRNATGKDGKEAFCIPVMDSSRDENYLLLDGISFKTYLENNSLHSEYLHWYVDYCLRDDFGTRYDETSAWMGIHYFASRKGISANAEANDVLTWPEGNGKLADELRKRVKGEVATKIMALHVEHDGKKAKVTVFDSAKNEYQLWECEHVILAVPQFVCHKILDKNITHPVSQKIEYAPWLIANITAKPFAGARGVPLAWDNVIYGSTGLGYVNACHQHLKIVHEKVVLTYYKPLLEKSPADMRKSIRGRKNDEWKKMVIDDLRTAHTNIEEHVEDIEIFVTGHSMPQPKKGLMQRILTEEAAPTKGIYFCHSDLSGYSIFEEAFYHGHRAAQQLMEQVKHA